MTRVVLAANQGEIGGGEVMLLALARAATELGHEVHVVAPAAAGGVADAARRQGWEATELSGRRAAYGRDLRRWAARHGGDLFWAGGLLPALATAGRTGRVVHLHQTPVGAQRYAARLARVGAVATVVPSRSTAAQVPGSVVLANWTADVRPRVVESNGPVRLGFLGRPGLGKGSDVLARALARLDGQQPGGFSLFVAGESRFVAAAERVAVAEAEAPVAHLVTHGGWTDPADALGQVDLLVVPSVQPESFGLVAAEAMAARVPVVVTDAGALPEVVGPAHPWVARAGDPVDLARVVRAAVDAGAAARAEVVAAARQRWEREFSPDAGRARLAALLADLGAR